MAHGFPVENWWTAGQAELVEDRSLTWRRQQWNARDAWMSPDGAARPFGAFPDGARPPDDMRLVKDGWDHDRCQLCWETFAEAPHGQPEGYTDGTQRWLCIACFETYLTPRLRQANLPEDDSCPSS